MSESPKNIEKFTIDVVGDVTGKVWKGVFSTKTRLSHRDQLREDELRRDFLGKNPDAASERAKNQAAIFAMILTHLTAAPQWWEIHDNGLELEDDNVIGAIYGRILDIKTEAAKKLKAEAEAAKTELAKTVEK